MKMQQSEHNSRLIEYAGDGNIQGVRELLALGADPNYLETAENLNIGFTSLILAAGYGKLQVCRILIESGADPNLFGTLGKDSPLNWASIYGRLNVIKFLISKGADVNICDNHGYTPLKSAARCQRMDIVEYFRGLKGPLSLSHIILNLIEEHSIPKEGLPGILFQR